MTDSHCFTRRSAPWALALLLVVIALAGSAKAENSKLPVPRFASLGSGEVNMRTGPGEDRPKLWVYKRSGMPVEIIEEFNVWRRIRDWQGVVGWVKGNLLSGRRTVIVTDAQRAIHDDPLEASPIVARLDPGVIAKLLKCEGEWCRLDAKGYIGWLPRDQVWGVYPDEDVKE